jgi:hypothetical protein
MPEAFQPNTKQPRSSHRILGIISNEKYTGDCLMQKSFVNEQGKQVRNRGQRDQYLISGNHPAIISHLDLEQAQLIRQGGLRSNTHSAAVFTVLPAIQRLSAPFPAGESTGFGRYSSAWWESYVSRYADAGDTLFAITDERHATGHYFVEAESNGLKTRERKLSTRIQNRQLSIG